MFSFYPFSPPGSVFLLLFLVAAVGLDKPALFGSTSKNSKIGKNFLQSPIFVNVYGAQE